MSVFEGMGLLRGAPGTKVKLTVIRGNAAEPHVVEITREEASGAMVSGKLVKPRSGWCVAGFNDRTAPDLKRAVLTKEGAKHVILDLRATAEGAPELGVASARLFVGEGVLTSREARNEGKRDITAAAGDGAITVPVVLPWTTARRRPLKSLRHRSPATSADLIGEHTLAARRRRSWCAVPDGSGLWISTVRYLTPDGTAIHEKGLTLMSPSPSPKSSSALRHRPAIRSSRRRSSASKRRPAPRHSRERRASSRRNNPPQFSLTPIFGVTYNA